jgi:predicted dehydrogenase
MATSLRVALLEAAHWHTSMYVTGLHQAGARVVALSDSTGTAGPALAAELDCPVYATPEEALEAAKPDFVVAFGRHDRMPHICRLLLERGLPFLMEKPLGRSAEEVRALAELAERLRPPFAAVALPRRLSTFYREVQEARRAGRLERLCLVHARIVNGYPSRYPRWNCAWMLDPAISGGGPLRNLGIHGIDLFNAIVQEPVEVTWAHVSHRVYGLGVEEYAVVGLRSASGVLGLIEAGYTYPTDVAGGDSAWRLSAGDFYISETGSSLTIATPGRCVEQAVDVPASSYPGLVVDTLARFQRGDPPLATISDCLAAMELIDRAYALAQR